MHTSPQTVRSPNVIAGTAASASTHSHVTLPMSSSSPSKAASGILMGNFRRDLFRIEVAVHAGYLSGEIEFRFYEAMRT